MNVRVDLAGEHVIPAAVALLPETAGLPCEWLIARCDGKLAGAAAVAWRAWGGPSGFPLQVEVLPASRRRGVGRALISQAMRLSSADADGLWTFRMYPPSGEAHAFMTACGFAPRRRQLRFEASIQALLDVVAPMAARVRRSLQSDLRLVGLSEAPMEDLSWLLSSEFGGGPFRALHGLRRRASDENDHSLVMMVGDALAGVVLWRAADGVAHVDARVVMPGWRGGVVNLLLLEGGLIGGLSEGLTRMRFHCDDTVRDTISLARRCRADELESGAYYYAEIA